MTSMNINQIIEAGQTKCVKMSSKEIALLTGKKHNHVLRDIRKIISDVSRVEELRPKMDFKIERIRSGKRGRPEEVYYLDRELTFSLTTGYSNAQRFAVMHRLKDLERNIQDVPFQALNELSVKMKVSEELGKIGSGLMNKRKKDKRKLKNEEKQLLLSFQLELDFK